MTRRRLTPDSEEPELRAGGFYRGSHRLHQAMSAVRMVDHRLTGFSNRSEIGTFEGVVSDEIPV